MMEIRGTFTSRAGATRDVAIRIGDPVRGPGSWVARVEIEGFDLAHAIDVHGEDWAQAVELAAMGIPAALSLLVAHAGGGAVEPPFADRMHEPFDPARVPPEVRAALGLDVPRIGDAAE